MGHRKVSGAGGVDIRESSIRLIFTWNGKQRKEALRDDDGRSMAPSAANIKFAKRLVAEINDRIRLGAFDFSETFPFSRSAKSTAPDTFEEFMDKWYAQLHLKSSTLTTYRRMKDNFWKPQLGHLAIAKVKHSDITTALKKGKWSSGKTRNNYVSMISSVFALAVADGLVEKNPCAAIEAAAWQKKKVDPFSLEEADAILQHMADKYPEQVRNFYEFQFFTGLRTGEAIGLEWTEVDMREKTATVKQAFVTNGMTGTKTSKERTVHLNSRALAALKRQQAWTYLQQAGRVFHDPGTGKPWAYEQNARKRYWEPTIKALGIRYRRPYNTRHTYATVGLMAGVNPAYMAGQLGHGTDVFFKDYASWISSKQDMSEMEKIEGKLGQR